MPAPIAFETSCARLSDLPRDGTPEITLVGRSNVGKSSLLNALAGRELARTSRTPGRTRLLNLYRVGDGRARLVDCPGYGYARAGRGERQHWGELVEGYLTTREPLRWVWMLVDARLEPQEIDLDIAAWLRDRGREPRVIATKWDKLSGNQRPLALRRLDVFASPLVPFSAVTGEGRETLLRFLLNP